LTCYNWKSAAQKVFFSDVSICSSSDINNISNIIFINKELGEHAKTLHYTGENNSHTATLLAMQVLFPKVEKIDFSNNNNNLYTSFCKTVTEGGKFSNLQALPSPMNREQAQLHIKCLDYLKDRITSIELYDDNNNAGSLYKDLHNKLNRYPKLKEVRVLASDTRVYFKDFIKYFKPIIETDLSYLQDLFVSSLNDCSYLRFSAIDQNNYLSSSKLKKIQIIKHSECHYVSSEEFMLFIMSKYPILNFTGVLKNNTKKSHLFMKKI
jgi:hypothetical protein